MPALNADTSRARIPNGDGNVDSLSSGPVADVLQRLHPGSGSGRRAADADLHA